MRQDRHQIARNSIIHAELLVNIANRALSDERPDYSQDLELTADIYKLARGCEALNDTLTQYAHEREAGVGSGAEPGGTEQTRPLDDPEWEARR